MHARAASMSSVALLQHFLSLPQALLQSVAVMGNAYRYLVGLLSLQLSFSSQTLAAPHASSGGFGLDVPAGHLGAVASESEICSHIGIDLLKMGGNAADAAVSVGKHFSPYIEFHELRRLQRLLFT